MKRVTRIERLLMIIVATLVVATPIITITITSQGFSYNKTITKIDDEIAALEQESKELEVKKQEKLSYSEVQEYAARDNLSANRDNYVRI
jgi:Protein required for the initiation of cell division